MQILKIRFRSNSEFEQSYDEELPNGGMFCPTTQSFSDGAKVIVELSAPSLPNKVLIRGTVRSWRPALPRLRVRAGALVEFAPDESEKRDFILESIAGNRPEAIRRKHLRLPLEIPIRYRVAEDPNYSESLLTEISVGGAMLNTSAPIPLETDIILEIVPPGAVSPIHISGKTTFHNKDGGTGLKFVYRDGGGSRRLRELIRRLRQT